MPSRERGWATGYRRQLDDFVATEVCTPVMPISDHRPLVIDVSLR